jgi:hypothetical protein
VILLENSHKIAKYDTTAKIPINFERGIFYSGGIKMKKLSKVLFGIAILGIMSFSVPVAQSAVSAAGPIENIDLPFEH